MEIVYPMFAMFGLAGVLTLSLAWAYVALWLTMFIGLVSAAVTPS